MTIADVEEHLEALANDAKPSTGGKYTSEAAEKKVN
jgi:hypothetical protein